MSGPDTPPIPTEYEPWVLDESTGILISIVTRTDTGEVIGKNERTLEEALE